MMCRKLVCIAILITSTYGALFSQTDNVGSGGAIQFDGVDDYIDFGDIYRDLKLPFTISAWVKLDPANHQPAPIFTNRNCDPIYTGFRLIVNNNVISMDFGDGLGGNNPAYRHGKNANVDLLTGYWNHITAVVRGLYDIELYLNGVNVGGAYSGGSSQTMDSNKPGFASTGYFISNGVIYRFSGIVDEVRLWNRALSESEIRATMCVGLNGSEPGLIGYWDFNETAGSTVFDRSANHFNGTFVGSPKRLRSGAPIGDESIYLYPTSWTAQELTLKVNDKEISVKDVSNLCKGVQIYAVKKLPSITTGITPAPLEELYFGVFATQQFPASSFSVEINNNCSYFIREDNSTSPWRSESVTGVQRRVEIIQAVQPGEINFDLGDDITVCDNSQYEITTGLDEQDHAFEWSNQATTPSISVTSSGIYVVKVSNECELKKDSVNVTFLSTPTPFTLGEDLLTCDLNNITLTAPQLSSSSVKWNNGSVGNSLVVHSYGKYWATVKNSCGESSDTINIVRRVFDALQVPNVITPNNDNKNDTFVILDQLDGPVDLTVYNRWGKLIHHESSYNNDWPTDNLTSGVYFLTLRTPCLKFYKGTLHVLK